MLKITFATLILIPTALSIISKYLFQVTLAYATLIAFYSLNWLYRPLTQGQTAINCIITLDNISSPLVILTTWLLPLIILASQNYISHEPPTRQRIFILTCAALQVALIIAFTATTFTIFYIIFEATLLPTLVLITRWGNQAERLIAGTYFLFYTLTGSLPFLIALLILHATTNSTAMLLLTLIAKQLPPTVPNIIMWAAITTALLIKLPIYGLHLWLPKAHVEAPVAGSIILAAVLLKLGGYGLIRISPILAPITQSVYFLPITLALWGILITSLICLRHTDLKAIIAYSSISHIGLVIAAAIIQTPWSVPGAITLIIAHGLTSSLLFSLTNTIYERTHTRTLIITRGYHIMFPLITTWWLLSSLINLALPPTINFLGELIIIIAIFNWSTITIIFTGLTILLTAIYTLHIFITSQYGKAQIKNSVPPTHTREHLLMILHLTPLLLITFKPDILF